MDEPRMLNDSELEALGQEVEAKRSAAEAEAPGVVDYVDTVAKHRVELVRHEYTGFADRNFMLIMRFSKRTMVLLSATIAMLLALGGGAVVLSGKQTSLSVRNCHSITELAKIERRYINQQQAQTTGLLKGGVTFGIPKEQLPGLIARSEAQQTQYLGELDELAKSNCS